MEKCHGTFFIIGRKGLIILDKVFFSLKTSHVYFLMKRQEDISTEIVEKGSKSLFFTKRMSYTNSWVNANFTNTTYQNILIPQLTRTQRYTYRVLQTIQMKLILLCVWAEWTILGSAKTALKFKYEI